MDDPHRNLGQSGSFNLVLAMFQNQDLGIFDQILQRMGPELDKLVDSYKIDPDKEYGGHFAKLIQSYLLNGDQTLEDSAAIDAMRQLFFGNLSRETNNTLLKFLGYSWNDTVEGPWEVKRVRSYSNSEALLVGYETVVTPAR